MQILLNILVALIWWPNKVKNVHRSGQEKFNCYGLGKFMASLNHFVILWIRLLNGDGNKILDDSQFVTFQRFKIIYFLMGPWDPRSLIPEHWAWVPPLMLLFIGNFMMHPQGTGS